MIEAWCNNCGARFRVENSMAGRTARCGRCNSRVSIPDIDDFNIPDEPEFPVSGISDLGDEEDLPLEAETVVQDGDMSTLPITLDSATDSDLLLNARRRAVHAKELDTNQHWSMLLLNALGFVFAGRNWICYLVTGIVAWALFFTVKNLMGFFVCVGVFIVYGTALTMMFEIVLDSCDGREDLANMMRPAEGGDIFASLAKMLFSIFWSALPGVLIAVTVAYIYANSIAAAGASSPTAATGGPATDALMWLLIAAICGISLLMFWPMTMLILGVYGLDFSMLRYDVIIVNIFRTFGAYSLLTGLLIMLTAAIIASSYISGAGHINWLSDQNIMLKIAISIVDMYIKLYCYVTVMRLIGIYYMSQRKRLTWERQ